MLPCGSSTIDGGRVTLAIGSRVRLDARDDRFGLALPPVQQEPARALRHVSAQREYREAQEAPRDERDPPAPCRREDARIEDDDRTNGTNRRADPEAAVDRQIDASTQPGRHEFLNGGIDRRIFAADAGTGEEAQHRKRDEARRETRRNRRARIQPERDEEQPAASVTIGQRAENDRADDRAGDVHGSGVADLRGTEAEAGGPRERAGKRADERDFESIDDPARTERRDQQRMKS